MGASLASIGGLNVEITENTSRLDATLSGNASTFDVGIAQASGDISILPPLHLRPAADPQYVRTSAGRAYNQIELEGIPYYETTNESGGYTVIIGD